jgi:glucokinase
MSLDGVGPAGALAIGVDLGGTKIAAALVGRDGRVLETRQVPTPAESGPGAVLDLIAAQIDQLAGSLAPEATLEGRPRAALSVAAPLSGVGIGSPGQVDSLRGVVRNAVNLGWDEVPLVAEVRQRLTLDIPVWVQKDANASALGENYFGSARSCKDFVYLSIGSGLGGGIVTNGMLVTGADWNAAELGHLSLDPDGLLCNCGSRGCAETVISGPGLLALVENYLALDEVPTRLSLDQDLTTQAILAAAGAGDALALAALREVGRQFGVVMAVCVAALNPERIIVGGGLGLAAYEILLPAARAELRRRVLPVSYRQLQILPSTLASSAVGAACLVWYFLEKWNLYKEKEVV